MLAAAVVVFFSNRENSKWQYNVGLTFNTSYIAVFYICRQSRLCNATQFPPDSIARPVARSPIRVLSTPQVPQNGHTRGAAGYQSLQYTSLNEQVYKSLNLMIISLTVYVTTLLLRGEGPQEQAYKLSVYVFFFYAESAGTKAGAPSLKAHLESDQNILHLRLYLVLCST